MIFQVDDSSYDSEESEQVDDQGDDDVPCVSLSGVNFPAEITAKCVESGFTKFVLDSKDANKSCTEHLRQRLAISIGPN
jgi:hypothetical protein